MESQILYLYIHVAVMCSYMGGVGVWPSKTPQTSPFLSRFIRIPREKPTNNTIIKGYCQGWGNRNRNRIRL